MAMFPIEGSYGKQCVPVVKVRKQGQHEVFDMVVATKLEGPFEEAYRSGDNSRILPTETQKNTCYAEALKTDFTCIEQYALALGSSFMNRHKHFTRATVEVVSSQWNRLSVDGKPHHHVFVGSPNPIKSFCVVTVDREGHSIQSGVRDMCLMKTMNSGFAGYIIDEYTDLKAIDTSQSKVGAGHRVMCTEATLSWTFQRSMCPNRIGEINQRVMKIMLDTFAGPADVGVYSKSVQETAHKMGMNVLNDTSSIQEVAFNLPNIHHYVYELDKFGLKNDNEVFRKAGIPQNASGIIDLTIRRPVSRL